MKMEKDEEEEEHLFEVCAKLVVTVRTMKKRESD